MSYVSKSTYNKWQRQNRTVKIRIKESEENNEQKEAAGLESKSAELFQLNTITSSKTLGAKEERGPRQLHSSCDRKRQAFHQHQDIDILSNGSYGRQNNTPQRCS